LQLFSLHPATFWICRRRGEKFIPYRRRRSGSPAFGTVNKAAIRIWVAAFFILFGYVKGGARSLSRTDVRRSGSPAFGTGLQHEPSHVLYRTVRN
jgi:hypothetical protein